MVNKVIFLDMGIFAHRAGYSLIRNNMPVKYTCMNMIISCLKIIGVNEGDLVIVACDGRNNWRKEHSDEYKSGRKAQRDDSGLDWDDIWSEMNDLLDDIEIATNWAVINVDRLEADDVMAVGCRYFKDKEVVLVTYDTDLEQMWEYPNVKIFSQHPKTKAWKIKPKNFNVYQLIAKKKEKEISDGLVSSPKTKEEYAVREMLVNLLTLPDFVEEPLKKAFDRIDYDKDIKLNLLPGRKIPEVFMNIYKKDKVVTYEQQVEKINKKEERIRLRKEKEKEKKKRKKDRENKKLLKLKKEETKC